MHRKLLKTVIFLILYYFSSSLVTAQSPEIDSLGYETFEMVDGDTSYIMQKYFMAFLKEGPNRDQSPEEAALIQKGHLNHLKAMAEAGQISIAGPFGDEGPIRGIVVFNVATLKEAEDLVSQDPAVKAGRLILEIHPWWAAKGSQLK